MDFLTKYRYLRAFCIACLVCLRTITIRDLILCMLTRDESDLNVGPKRLLRRSCRFNTVHHRLRIRVLRILKFPKIHEFLRILKLSILKFIKFKLSHSSPPSSKKLYVADTALNFWIKNSVMSTIRDSLTRQHLNSSAWSRAAYYKVYAPAASLSSPSPAHC